LPTGKGIRRTTTKLLVRGNLLATNDYVEFEHARRNIFVARDIRDVLCLPMSLYKVDDFEMSSVTLTQSDESTM
jgi:hypothetical protein